VCTALAWADVPFEDVSSLIDVSGITASTVAWGDVNGDGRPDLFIGDAGENGSQLFLNNGHGFEEANGYYGIHYLTAIRTAQFVDYDRDGLLDLFCLTNDRQCLRLMHQTSDQRFEDVPLLSGIAGRTPIHSAAWTDMDGDGKLDLLLSNHPDTDKMRWLRQSGGVAGEFIEVLDVFPSEEPAAGALCVVDFDADGDLDLLAGYAYGNQPARLYLNHDGVYYPYQHEVNLPAKCGTTGAAWVDFDNDRWLDLVVPGVRGETYLLNSDPREAVYPEFSDWSGHRGFHEGADNSVYVHAADFNRDGYQDLLVIRSGDLTPVVMLNNGGKSWSSQTWDWIFSPYQVRTADGALADFDGDGDVDIAFAQGPDVRLYRNDYVGRQEWIGISLMNTQSSTPALDCQMVMVFNGSNQIATTSWINSSAGQDGAMIFLANASQNESTDPHLFVSWPNGMQSDYSGRDIVLNDVNKFYEPPINLGPGEVAAVPAAPSTVELSSAPNPFNPTATVSFTLPASAQVRLAVYDLTGREVAVLASAPYAAGSHSVTFDASNLPTGLYFARLTAGAETKLHRMLLIK
jgi:hypothetical protein